MALNKSDGRRSPARVFWLYGLSGAGKSTIARATAATLRAAHQAVLVIDGDDLRAGLCRDLGFTAEDRIENVRRAAELARLFGAQGLIVLVALMTPHENMRNLARKIVGPQRFKEIYIRCDFATCALRDPKGLYARAAASKISHFPGEDFAFEEPRTPDLVLDTAHQRVSACVQLLLKEI